MTQVPRPQPRLADGGSARSFWLEALGCPKNDVDADKVSARLQSEGLVPAESPECADVVVVNTCAFVEEARQESIDAILRLADGRREGAELVVTGCLAERNGAELAEAIPEIDRVVGFGGPMLPNRRSIPVQAATLPTNDLLNMPRRAADGPWAYVKIAEGCDRACGFCAIPSFRGPQRSRSIVSVVEEVRQLSVREVVLVAQDLASFGRDQGRGQRTLVPLIDHLVPMVDRVRLLYLYPSDLTPELIDAVLATGVPYFDLSLQHVSATLLRRMRRWGDGERFSERLATIRRLEPSAVFRSNFIVGYPGETEEDHDALCRFLVEAELDWCGFFAFSREEGTFAADLAGQVPAALVEERLRELGEIQDAITARKRDELIGETVSVLVDKPGRGRTFREAPEIDGVVRLTERVPIGAIVDARVVSAVGSDLEVEVHATSERAGDWPGVARGSRSEAT